MEDLHLDDVRPKVSRSAVAACVGNMMNVSVLHALLPRVLCLATFVVFVFCLLFLKTKSLAKLITVEEFDAILEIPNDF